MNSNITVRQLRAFVAVARERSFTKAAGTLNITQSALTTAVKSLETELGLKLFDRTTRIVEPTSYGMQFARVAQRLLDELEQSVDDLRAHAERQQGLVVVGATATMISHVLVPAVSMLAKEYPGIRVRLVEELTEGAVRRVQSGELDLAFTTIEQSGEDVELIPIFRDQFELVCASDHPLGSSNVVLPWNAFADHPSIALSWQSGIRGLLDRSEVGRTALQSIHYEVSSVSGLKSMVKCDLGLAAVPALIASEMSGDDVTRRRLSPILWRTVSLTTRRGRSLTPAASALVTAALDRLDELQDQEIELLYDRRRLSEYVPGLK